MIQPLGFALTDKRLRRAGLDYREYAEITEHESLQRCMRRLDEPRLLAVSTRGRTAYDKHAFVAGDAILLGPETRGLPAEILESLPDTQVLRIPMRPNNRSLNLSNAAAIVLYEAWRQLEFQ